MIRPARVTQLIDSVTPPKENIISHNLNNQWSQRRVINQTVGVVVVVVGGGALTSSEIKTKKRDVFCSFSPGRLNMIWFLSLRRRRLSEGGEHNRCAGPAQHSLIGFN